MEQTAFISYSGEDTTFALKLATDLKSAGASVWLDKLDLVGGDRWDLAVEKALKQCTRILVILSRASVDKNNVLDEVSFALDEQRTVVPILYQDCEVPFRLRRLQYVDFRKDYEVGLRNLLRTLATKEALPQLSIRKQVTTNPEPAPVQEILPSQLEHSISTESENSVEKSNWLARTWTARRRSTIWGGVSLAFIVVLLGSYLKSSYFTRQGGTAPEANIKRPAVRPAPTEMSSEPIAVPRGRVPSPGQIRSYPVVSAIPSDVNWKTQVSQPDRSCRFSLTTGKETHWFDQIVISFRRPLEDSFVQMSVDILLRADKYGMPSKKQKDAAIRGYQYEYIKGTLRIGKTSFSGKPIVEHPFDNQANQKLWFFGDTEMGQVTKYLQLLGTRGKAMFTITNGPDPGTSMEIPLSGLPQAYAQCPFLP